MQRKIPKHKQDLIDLIINRIKQKNHKSAINFDLITYIKNYVLQNSMDVNQVTFLEQKIRQIIQDSKNHIVQTKSLKDLNFSQNQQQDSIPKIEKQQSRSNTYRDQIKNVTLLGFKNLQNQFDYLKTKSDDQISTKSNKTQNSWYKSKIPSVGEWTHVYNYIRRDQNSNEQNQQDLIKNDKQFIKTYYESQMQDKINQKTQIKNQDKEYYKTLQQNLNQYDIEICQKDDERKLKLKHEYEKIHNFKLENEARRNIEKKAEKIVDYQLAQNIKQKCKKYQDQELEQRQTKQQTLNSEMMDSIKDRKIKNQIKEVENEQFRLQNQKFVKAQNDTEIKKEQDEKNKQTKMLKFFTAQSFQAKEDLKLENIQNKVIYNEQLRQNQQQEIIKNKENQKKKQFFIKIFNKTTEDQKFHRKRERDDESEKDQQQKQQFQEEYELQQQQDKQKNDVEKQILRNHSLDVKNQIKQKQMLKSVNLVSSMDMKEMIWNKNLIKQYIKKDPTFASQMERCTSYI